MPEILGRHGWLYNETKALHDEGAILSCSGDSPFQLRMLKGVSSDVSCHSKLCLYVPDPMCVSALDRAGSKQQTQTNKKGLEAKGVILPSTVDCVTGRRTELNIEVNEEIPKESLLFLKSTFNTCPDVLHMIVRSVKSDLKLHVDALLLSKDANAISRLECNITDRNVKPPRFKFEVVDKLCKPVSLSFRDAEVILSDCTRTCEYGRTDQPLFEGVYSKETPYVYKTDQTGSTTPYNVLISLVGDLEKSFSKGIGISVRTLADLQFQSLYHLLEILRQRELSQADLQRCKNLYETYYQCTVCLFGDRDLTPYKLKLDMLLRIVEKGEILPPFFYMTEGTEKCHHTANKDYNSKTMRDGGNDAWNMSSNYLDIQFSFRRAITLCSSKAAMLRRYRHVNENFKSYLEICREPIPEPVLDNQRTDDIFRCINFVVLGSYGHIKETQSSIEKKIRENGGTILNNTDIVSRSKLSFLSHHYCVLPNRNVIDTFIGSPLTKETATTKAFFLTTQGNWTYISADFILACLKEKSLVDPKDYMFNVDVSARIKFRRIRHQSIAPQLQRQSQPMTSASGSITYHTALRKYKNALQRNFLKRKISCVD